MCRELCNGAGVGYVMAHHRLALSAHYLVMNHFLAGSSFPVFNSPDLNYAVQIMTFSSKSSFIWKKSIFLKGCFCTGKLKERKV